MYALFDHAFYFSKSSLVNTSKQLEVDKLEDSPKVPSFCNELDNPTIYPLDN